MSHPLWPHQLLDVERLRTTGWRPVPLHSLVLKVHQRCNLACDYCYVYELADQSWRDRPSAMSPDVWRMTFTRLSEHVRRHNLTSVDVILHGGEPLLAGRDNLAMMISDLHIALPTSCTPRISMQTNGLLLDEPLLDLLRASRVDVGVSLDGSPADHDRHRRFRDGRGSSAGVHRALSLLSSETYRSIFAGLLCTVDPTTNPVATYESLLTFAPPTVDLLLPHANWSAPPSRPVAEYAEWLIEVFDRWYGVNTQETHVQLFEDAISLVLGGGSRSEQLGLSPAAFAVVESDGAIEQVDALKSAYPGAPRTGRNVATHSFDDAFEHPGMVARQIGVDALSDKCRACPVMPVCGGGHYAHRYRSEQGFRNPSVYCTALQKFLGHVHRRVASDLAVSTSGESR